jgi:Domain of unknown function (DUF4260)
MLPVGTAREERAFAHPTQPCCYDAEERCFPVNPVASAVTGVPRMLLRIEGACILAIAIALYWRLGDTWWLFAILFLAPDLSFLGYLAGARIGAIAYNLLHTIAGPILLALSALLVPYEPAMAVALIWLAHCGFDRALGYGLKYEAGFGFTHLGRIGRAA